MNGGKCTSNRLSQQDSNTVTIWKPRSRLANREAQQPHMNNIRYIRIINYGCEKKRVNTSAWCKLNN